MQMKQSLAVSKSKQQPLLISRFPIYHITKRSRVAFAIVFFKNFFSTTLSPECLKHHPRIPLERTVAALSL
jgi:hypothetical protein